MDEESESNLRICPWCYEPLVRKPNEQTANWNKRIYCDKTHASKHLTGGNTKRFRTQKTPIQGLNYAR